MNLKKKTYLSFGRMELKKEHEGPERNDKQFVIFEYEGEKYLVNIDVVQEIIKPGVITEVPFVSEYIIGIINLRGKIVPVVDVKMRFGLEKSEIKRSTRIVIVNHRESLIGMLVDAVAAVAPFDLNAFLPAPQLVSGMVDTDFFAGIANKDGDIYILLDLDKTLKKPDWNMPAESERSGQY